MQTLAKKLRCSLLVNSASNRILGKNWRASKTKHLKIIKIASNLFMRFAKLASVGIAISFLFVRRLPLPPISDNPVALLAGALDAGANAFYLLATRYTRLDVAVVLASLYPAVTVLLSRAVLREQISRLQWLGVALCVAAIMLILK